MKKTRAQLLMEIKAITAQMYHTPYFAYSDMKKCEVHPASAVLLTITELSGKEIIPTVSISGGLSKETIEAIKKDIARSQKNLMDFTIKENKE